MAKQHKEEDHMQDDDGERKKTIILRWLIDGARYAVAALVIVLTIAVIGGAIVVSARSEDPFFQVANGYMSAKPNNNSSSPSKLRLTLKLIAYNPSGRVSMQYTGVNVSLFYDDSWEAITWFRIKDTIPMEPKVPRQVRSTTNLDVPNEVPLDFVLKISKYGEMKNMGVLLTGNITQISALKFTRGGHFTKYRCFPVTIGVQQLSRYTGEDVQCLHLQE